LYADLKFRAGEDVRAAEMVAMVENHPACDTDSLDEMKPLKAKITAKLSEDIRSVAEKRGKKLDLDKIVEGLLVTRQTTIASVEEEET
jgi:hypothetical protein